MAPRVEQYEPGRSGQPFARGARRVERIAARDHTAHLGMMHYVTRLLHTKLGIDRHHDGANARESEQCQHMAFVVARHHSYALIFTHATRDEQTRSFPDRRAELSPT